MTATNTEHAPKALRRKTLADVAEVVGVSVSTVSAVLGDKPHCFASASTRQQVIDAAQRMGYRPNLLARGLRGDKTQTIGLVMYGLDRSSVGNAKLQSIEDAAWQHGYRLLIGTHKDDRQRLHAYFDEFLSRAVDGVIFWPTMPEDGRLIAQVRNAGAGVVTIEAPAEFDVPDVAIDREHGTYLQVRHLLEIGRRRIAFLFTSHLGHTGQAKVRGIRRALGEAGLDLADHTVIEEPRPRGVARAGVAMTEQLLDTGKPFDALLALSDSVALSAIATLLRRGARVPDDIAVIGFDDEMAPEGMVVPLSTVRQPRQIGASVFDLLLPQIAGQPMPQPTPRVRLRPHLVVRESTVADTGVGTEDER